MDDKFAKLYPSATGEQVETDDGVPTPDATEPPGFARPSPATDGAPPGQKKYTTSDPEVQAIIQANDSARFKQMVDAGEIELRGSPPITPG